MLPPVGFITILMHPRVLMVVTTSLILKRLQRIRTDAV